MHICKMTYHLRGAAYSEKGHSRWSRVIEDADRSSPFGSHRAASGQPFAAYPDSSSGWPPWDFQHCDASAYIQSERVLKLERIRPVIHRSGPFHIVGRDTIGHAITHHLVLRVHGIVHHHALISLIVLHLCEVLAKHVSIFVMSPL